MTDLMPEQEADYMRGVDPEASRAMAMSLDEFIDNDNCECSGPECLCDFGPVPR